MEYYLLVGGQQSGPFDKSQLEHRGIAGDAYVWREGFAEWQPAAAVPELRSAVAPPRSDGWADGRDIIDSPGGTTFGEKVRARADLVILSMLALWLAADVTSLLVTVLNDYGTPSFFVISTISSVLWMGFSASTILLALLIKNPAHRPIGIGVAVLIALYGVFNAIRYSQLYYRFFEDGYY